MKTQNLPGTSPSVRFRIYTEQHTELESSLLALQQQMNQAGHIGNVLLDRSQRHGKFTPLIDEDGGQKVAFVECPRIRQEDVKRAISFTGLRIMPWLDPKGAKAQVTIVTAKTDEAAYRQVKGSHRRALSDQ